MDQGEGAGAIASIVFAAGRGNRLRPLTDRLPKPAVPLLDVPLAAFALSSVAASSPPVAMNLSHLADQAFAVLSPFLEGAGVEVVVEPPAAYGSGGTLARLRDRIGERIVTYNCDLLSDIDMSELLAAHGRSGARATLAVAAVSSGADFELRRDTIARFVDRRSRAGQAGAVYIGAGVFEREALDLLPDTIPCGLGEAVIAPLANNGELAAYFHGGYYLDVGTVDRYLQASLDLAAGRGPPAPVDYPGDFAAVDRGRVYVGPGAVVEGARLGDGAVVLAGATVGAGAGIEQAVVWPDERVPPGKLVRRAVWAFDRSIEGSG